MMVMTLADAKLCTPVKLRDVLKKECSAHAQVDKLLDSVQYWAGGQRMMPDFRFSLKAGGIVLVRSYNPGDWELASKRAYDELVARSGPFEGVSVKLPEPLRRAGEASPSAGGRKPQLSTKLPQSISHPDSATRPPVDSKRQMRTGMQPWRGHCDIRPLLALAEGLQSAGHEVSLAITCIYSAEYNASISNTGVKVLSVASPVIRDKDEFANIEKSILHEDKSAKRNHTIMTKSYLPAEADVYELAEQPCADSDLVIGQYWSYPLQAAAEKAGRHHVSVMFQPRQ